MVAFFLLFWAQYRLFSPCSIKQEVSHCEGSERQKSECGYGFECSGTLHACFTWPFLQRPALRKGKTQDQEAKLKQEIGLYFYGLRLSSSHITLNEYPCASTLIRLGGS